MTNYFPDKEKMIPRVESEGSYLPPGVKSKESETVRIIQPPAPPTSPLFIDRELRKLALDRALEKYSDNSSTRDETIIETAKKFESYLKGE